MQLNIDGHELTTLDESLQPGTCRITVHQLTNISAVEGLYFVRQRSIRTLIAYSRELGIRPTWEKVRSRRRERWRNQKWVSAGLGTVSESAAEELPVGLPVAFVAPCHPPMSDSLVLDERLIRACEGTPAAPTVVHCDALIATDEIDSAAEAVAGWTPWSGTEPHKPSVRTLIEVALGRPTPRSSWSPARTSRATPITSWRRTGPRSSGHHEGPPPAPPRIRIVGYGNYAKTVILPAAPSSAEVIVHELDPLQMGDVTALDHRVAEWHTSPDVSAAAGSELVVVAGYHHTHAGTALAALAGNNAVLIEKPAATTMADVAKLRQALAASDAPRAWVGFNRRYSPLTTLAVEDLTRAGEPVHYTCTAFEEPLPKRHWYTWPASRGSLVSNGCHWIDHFLMLNAFSRVADRHAIRSDGVTSLWIRLENRATFSLTLTHVGSARLGVREIVQLRSADRTAILTDQRTYHCESTSKVIRKKQVGKLSGHHAMYREIFAAYMGAGGRAGDTPHDALAATAIAIELEDELSS